MQFKEWNYENTGCIIVHILGGNSEHVAQA